jgi:hypothetical protein
MRFGPPTLVPGLSMIGAGSVDGVRLSRDYRTAYFHAVGRSDSVGYNDLYAATRDAPGSAFGGVSPIEGSKINTTAEEQFPTVSGDGLVLAYARGQPSGDPIHIYYATRATISLGFTFVGQLVTGLGAQHESFPFLREDANVLYFSVESNDIYQAPWDTRGLDASLGQPLPIQAINTPSSEVAPVVTPDDLTIYFGSNRTDGGARGYYDIWVATRSSRTAEFSQPQNVMEINSPEFEWPTFVAADGCTLYFSSTRGGTLLPYVAKRQRGEF